MQWPGQERKEAILLHSHAASRCGTRCHDGFKKDPQWLLAMRAQQNPPFEKEETIWQMLGRAGMGTDPGAALAGSRMNPSVLSSKAFRTRLQEVGFPPTGGGGVAAGQTTQGALPDRYTVHPLRQLGGEPLAEGGFQGAAAAVPKELM